jgi:hypothetical protein
MNNTRVLFDRVLADEPPLLLTVEPVVAAGRRARRRRRVAYGACTVSLAAVAVAAVAALPRGTTAVTSRPLASAGPQRQAVDPGLTPAQRAMAQAIVDTSPAGWTFELGPDRWDGLDLEGTADDGAGPGRLMAGVSTGTQLLRPCQDKEFAQDSPCHERALADGSWLTVRRATAYNGVVWTDATLTHPDGSGVLVEVANATLTWPLPTVTTETEKERLFHVTRPAPVYDDALVADLLVALDRVTKDAQAG